MKITGRSNLLSTLDELPIPEVSKPAISRILRLNCLTSYYAPIWDRHSEGAWDRDSALRIPRDRRKALVELDALAAIALGITADELCTIYRVQFPVLYQYEHETFYDQRGHIVFTINRGLTGVGLERKQWEEIQDAQSGDTLPEWAVDNAGRAYIPPFDLCDREEDMRRAYEFFKRRENESF